MVDEKGVPVGLVFIMSKSAGEMDIEKTLQPHFPTIIKHLSDEAYVKTQEEFNKIFDGQFVHFVRLEDSDFQKLNSDSDLIGGTALDVYKAYHQVQPHEDVEVLHYQSNAVPWGFELYVCVLYGI